VSSEVKDFCSIRRPQVAPLDGAGAVLIQPTKPQCPSTRRSDKAAGRHPTENSPDPDAGFLLPDEAEKLSTSDGVLRPYPTCRKPLKPEKMVACLLPLASYD